MGVNITLRVVDSSGSPLADARCELACGLEPDPPGPSMGYTDYEGYITIGVYDENINYMLTITKLGYDTHTETVYVGTQDMDLGTITLTGEGHTPSGSPPTIQAPTTVSGYVDEATKLTFTVDDPDGHALTVVVQWGLDSGSPSSNSYEVPTVPETITAEHIYPNTGTYQAGISATDTETLNTRQSVWINITERPANRAPTVEIFSLYHVWHEGRVADLGVHINDPDDDILHGSVNWGDGTIEDYTGMEDLSSFEHTYSVDGTYIVTVTAIDPKGLQASDSDSVKIDTDGTNGTNGDGVGNKVEVPIFKNESLRSESYETSKKKEEKVFIFTENLTECYLRADATFNMGNGEWVDVTALVNGQPSETLRAWKDDEHLRVRSILFEVTNLVKGENLVQIQISGSYGYWVETTWNASFDAWYSEGPPKSFFLTGVCPFPKIPRPLGAASPMSEAPVLCTVWNSLAGIRVGMSGGIGGNLGDIGEQSTGRDYLRSRFNLRERLRQRIGLPAEGEIPIGDDADIDVVPDVLPSDARDLAYGGLRKNYIDVE